MGYPKNPFYKPYPYPGFRRPQFGQLLIFPQLLAILLCLGLLMSQALALTFIENKQDGTSEPANGLTIDGLQEASAIALSANGQHVYVTGFLDQAVAVFSRDITTGKLTFVQVVKNPALDGAADLIISPDNRNVYVASRKANAVVTFTRNPTTGQIAILSISKEGDPQNNGQIIEGLEGAIALTLSQDRTRLYVAGTDDGAVSVFNRSLTDGTLTYLTARKDGVNADALRAAADVTVTRDNNFIYATSGLDNAVNVFQRSPALGELGMIQVAQGIEGLQGAFGITLSPDENFLYVAANTNPDNNKDGNASLNNSAIVAFSRSPTDGQLSLLQTYRNNTQGIEQMVGARSLLISPDGTELYVTAITTDAILVFDRDVTTGLLTYRSIIRNGSETNNSLDEVTGLARSQDGNFLYTSAVQSDAVSVFSTLSADLLLAVTDNAPVGINSTLTYTLTITNKGPETATELTLKDTLPGGVTFDKAVIHNGSCSHDAGQVSCQAGDLPAGSSVEIQITVKTPGVVGDGQLVNQATVSSSQPDGDKTNNTVQTTSELKETVPTADLGLAVKTNVDNANDVVNINSPLIYRLTASNQGPEPATNITVSSTLPEGLTYVSAASVPVGEASCSYDNGTRVVLCQAAELVNSKSIELEIQTTSPATPTAQPLNFTAEIQGKERDSDKNNNTVSKQTAVGELHIDLALMEVVGNPNSVTAGTQITYTAKIANNGSAPATGVVLNTTLPPEVRLAPTAGCTVQNQKVACNLGTISNIAPNNTKDFTVTVNTVQAAMNLNTEFTVTGNGTEDNMADNSKSAMVNITGQVADLVIRIEETADPIVLNETLTYTINVTNNGPDIVAVNLANVIDGENVAIGTISADGGSCTSGFSFSCLFDLIPVGETSSTRVEVIPTTLGTISLTSTATSQAYDPSASTVTEQTAVSNLAADLSVALSATPDPVLLGNNLVYTATVTNAGPSQALNTILTQTLPGGVELVSSQMTQGKPCTQDGTDVTCQLGPLALDATAEVYLEVKPQTLGELTSKAAVTSDVSDPTPPNEAEITTLVSQTEADLALTLETLPAEGVLVDNPFDVVLTLENAGPDEAKQVVVTYPIAENLTFSPPANIISADTNAQLGTCNEDNQNKQVVCELAALPNGATAKITLVNLPNLAGSYELQATVSSTEFDANEDNNTASGTMQVQNPSTLFPVDVIENGVDGVQGLEQVNDVAVSADGQYLYASGFASNSLVVFRRNSEGRLQFIQVLTNEATDLDGNTVSGLAGAARIAVSPDDRFIYVTGFNANAVAAFRRNTTNGTLRFIASYQDGNANIDGLGGAFPIVATERQVYVAGVFDNSVVVFDRNPETGTLNFAERHNQASLARVFGLTLSPNQLQLIAASPETDSLTIFNRAADTGRLTIFQTVVNGNGDITGLDSVNGVVVKNDGETLYTVADGSNNAIAAFIRDPGNGLLSFQQTLRDGDNTDIGVPVDGLNGAFDVAMSPDGRYVYAAGTADNAVAIFQPQQNGLTFIDVVRDGVDGINGLGGARALAVSPNGAQLYVAGFYDNAIGILRLASVDLNLSLKDNTDPIQVNEEVIYTLTVGNAGPDQAANVVTTIQLPENVNVLSYNPARGGCSLNNNQVTCRLGTLNKNAQTTVSLVLTPTAVGSLNLSATAFADQIDPTPAKVTEKTDVLAVADLGLELTAEPMPANINGDITYTATVRNQGPDPALNVRLINNLPANTQFAAAKIVKATPDDSDKNCRIEAGIVTCTLETIPAGSQRQFQIQLIPTQEGLLSNEISVLSDTYDPTAPNQATLEVMVELNIIEETYDNSGGRLTNYTVTSQGAVSGGELAGTTVNQGFIFDVNILPESQVIGGGKLGGTIVNEGRIENAQLHSDAILEGNGRVHGEITGFASAPATIHNHIAADAKLSNVIIGAGSTVDPAAQLGSGVTFADNHNIPAGLNLSNILPRIEDSVSGATAVNLQTDVLQGDSSLLTEINSLPTLVNQGFAFTQKSNGQLVLAVGNEHAVLWPWSVKQTDQPAGIYEQPDGKVIIITQSGREVSLQPSAEEGLALHEALRDSGWRHFTALADGTINIATNQAYYLKARLGKTTHLTNPLVPLGFDSQPSAMNNLPQILFRYQHTNGGETLRRQQYLYPAAANQSELRTAIEGIPGVEKNSVVFYNNGLLSLKLGTRSYQVMLDYTVRPGTANKVTQLLLIPDQNADGQEDVRVTYKNGDQQTLYVFPMPPVAELVQAIPTVSEAGLLVSQDKVDYLNFIHPDSQRYAEMQIVNWQTVDETTPQQMILHDDGSMELITALGYHLFNQPRLQDWAGFTDYIQKSFDIESMQMLANGNIEIVFEQGIISARPALYSELAPLTQPLGLQSTSSTTTAFQQGLWVFSSERGLKRQQPLYPAPYAPERLLKFLAEASAEEAALYSNGEITIDMPDFQFAGLFDYAVTPFQVPSGSIQLQRINDVNRDGLADYRVIYEDGYQQMIFSK